MKKLVYYVATTLDGFIAHEDGSFDGFIWDDEVVQDFFDSYNWFDTVLMGRKTYDVGLEAGKTSPYPMLKQYVFSKTMKESPDKDVELISDNAIDLIKELKEGNGKDIWLCGGGDLATQAFQNKLIDKLIIKLNPVVFGSGIPLFSRAIDQTALQLTDKKIYNCGILFLHYQVKY